MTPPAAGALRTAGVAGLLLSAAAGHVLYPVILRVTVHLRGAVETPLRRSAGDPPDLTVLIPAYLERGVIARKIRQMTEPGAYRGAVEVLVVADGDPETARVARAEGATVVQLPVRVGKSQAVNAGMAAARTEHVVLSDANSVVRPGSLDLLVDRLRRPGVGAVAAEKLEGTGGELAYWRFSSRLKRAEALLGGTLGLDGALCGLRRSAWQPIPEDVSNDDYWMALDLMERGWSVAYEPAAVVEEEGIGSVRRSWERRTRVLAGSLWVAWRKRHLLNPRHGLVSLELWGHKVWRSTIGPLSHVVLLAMALRHRGPVGLLFLAGHLAAGLGLVAELRGTRAPRPIRVAWTVLYLQAVALGGMLRFARGDRVVRWRKPAR